MADALPPDLPPKDNPRTSGVPVGFWHLANLTAGVVLPGIALPALAVRGLLLGTGTALPDTLAALPFAAYSIGCMVALVRDFEHFAAGFGCRFGVYTGGAIALHFSAWLTGELLFRPGGVLWLGFLVLAGCIPFVVRSLLLWMERTDRYDVRWAIVPLVVLPWFLLSSVVAQADVTSVLEVIYLGPIYATPVWVLSSYAHMSLRLLGNARCRSESSGKKFALTAAWLAGYVGAWFVVALAVRA